MNAPENGAVPDPKVEDKHTIELAGEINTNDTAHVKQWAGVVDCPLVCSFDRRSCPWEYPSFGGTR
jgi:hypothetical protein